MVKFIIPLLAVLSFQSTYALSRGQRDVMPGVRANGTQTTEANMECEVILNDRFDEILRLRLGGDCQRAAEIIQGILASCVVRDQAARTAVSLRFLASDVLHQCSVSVFNEACELIPTCMALVRPPGIPSKGTNTVRTPSILCENVSEADKCLGCLDSQECQLAEQYRNSLRVAAEENCPNIRTYTCPVSGPN